MHPTLATALERIAAREGCEPMELPPLYETIDPEAATTLLESNGAVTLCFEYLGYHVVADADSRGRTSVVIAAPG